MATLPTPFVVFGYGSLIFKPPPHTISQTPGFLKGYVRRFAQKSHDHRGTPEVVPFRVSNLLTPAEVFTKNPGRVVTLIHKEEWDKFSDSDAFPDDDTVWGIAYTIDPAHETEVREYLDYREKDGYTMETLDIYGIDAIGSEKVIIRNAFCYVGRNDNPSFVGSEPLDGLAHRIWISVGPSGPNKDYLYKLAEAIRQLSPNSFDSHLYALEAIVRKLDSANPGPTQ